MPGVGTTKGENEVHFHIKRSADKPAAAAFANSLIVSGKVCRTPALRAVFAARSNTAFIILI
jgi:hypothetical protein